MASHPAVTDEVERAGDRTVVTVALSHTALACAAATARTRDDAASAASAPAATTGGRLTATLAPWRKRSLTWAHYSVAPR